MGRVATIAILRRTDMAEAKDVARMLSTGFHPGGGAKAGCLLALLLFARGAIAQTAQGTPSRTTPTKILAAAAGAPAQSVSAPPTSGGIPAVSPKITYEDGQLRIEALDSTLADVLRKVASLTGVTIDIPAGANSERMPVVDFGPGPARQVLASLLSDSGFDFLIQASGTDPGKIQNVLLIARDKKGSGSNGAEVVARVSGVPSVRGVAQPEAPVPDSSVAVPPVSGAVESASSNPQPGGGDGGET
jgi:hypothetical protein